MEVKTDPITDAKTATVSTFESGDVAALDRMEIGILITRAGYGLGVSSPGLLLMDKVDAQMRFDEAPAETVPWAPAGAGGALCLRRDEIVQKLLAAKRVVLRLPLSGGRQKTAVFDFSGFKAAWSDALSKVGDETMRAAAAAVLERAGWKVDGATALRYARDMAWSATGGASPVIAAVIAKADGTAGLSFVCGVKVDAIAGQRVPIRLRLDDGEWSEARFVVGGDGDIVSYPGDATSVVKKLTAAKKMEAEITPLFGKAFVATFDLSGTAAALKRLKPKDAK